MTVNLREIMGWLQASTADLPGVMTAIGGLDLEESRQLNDTLLSLLKGLTVLQEVHVQHVEQAVFDEPNMSAERRAELFADCITNMHPGIRGLRQMITLLDKQDRDT